MGGLLPLLEELLTSFLCRQHLGGALVIFQGLLRNGALFEGIFQERVILKIKIENRICGTPGMISRRGTAMWMDSWEGRREGDPVLSVSAFSIGSGSSGCGPALCVWRPPHVA